MAKKTKKAKTQKKAVDPAGQGKAISENRKAKHKYEIHEQLECGVMLQGSEVKTLRDGKISLDEAYVRVRQGELWLVNADIPEYKQATIWNHDPKRPRKLLAQARQIRKLAARANEGGLTLVPLRIYFNARGLVKVMVGVGKGKKMHDKRQTLKTAEVKRQIDRAMRNKSRR